MKPKDRQRIFASQERTRRMAQHPFGVPRRPNGHGGVPINPLSLTALDRFSRPLAAGQLVLFRPANDLVFRVTKVTPSLDPAAPPGTVQVMLQADAPMLLQGGQPLANLVIVAEPGPDVAQTTDEATGPSAESVPLDVASEVPVPDAETPRTVDLPSV